MSTPTVKIEEKLLREIGHSRMLQATGKYREFLVATVDEKADLDEWELADLDCPPLFA